MNNIFIKGGEVRNTVLSMMFSIKMLNSNFKKELVYLSKKKEIYVNESESVQSVIDINVKDIARLQTDIQSDKLPIFIRDAKIDTISKLKETNASLRANKLVYDSRVEGISELIKLDENLLNEFLAMYKSFIKITARIDMFLKFYDLTKKEFIKLFSFFDEIKKLGEKEKNSDIEYSLGFLNSLIDKIESLYKDLFEFTNKYNVQNVASGNNFIKIFIKNFSNIKEKYKLSSNYDFSLTFVEIMVLYYASSRTLILVYISEIKRVYEQIKKLNVLFSVQTITNIPVLEKVLNELREDFS